MIRRRNNSILLLYVWHMLYSDLHIVRTMIVNNKSSFFVDATRN